MVVAGVDGCPNGWVLIMVTIANMEFHFQSATVVPRFIDVLGVVRDCRVIGVDIPIGLSDVARRGGRSADRAARSLLGPRFASSVFSPPPRPALNARSFTEAASLTKAHSQFGQSLTRQTYGILPKIAEVDAALTSDMRDWVFEVHPELSFRALHSSTPLRHKKHANGGVIERVRLLEAAGLGDVIEQAAPMTDGARLDDILDAAACAWSAHRIACDQADRVPAQPELDNKGLRMEIHW